MNREIKPHNWKGEKAGYTSKHQWMYKKFGKANKCEYCGRTEGYFEWANISGKYKRRRDDWLMLCKPCHMEFDDSPKKIWKKRKELYGESGTSGPRKKTVKGNKLHIDEVREIKDRLNKGETHRSIAEDYPVNFATIGQIYRGEIWSHA